LRNAVAGQIARPHPRRRSRFVPCTEARLQARRWCRPISRWMPAIFGRGEPPWSPISPCHVPGTSSWTGGSPWRGSL